MAGYPQKIERFPARFYSFRRQRQCPPVLAGGGLILLLILGEVGLWLAMPLTEVIVCFGAVCFMRKYTQELG